MEDAAHVRRLIGQIGLKCFVIKADDQKSAISITNREDRLDDLRYSGGFRRIKPTLDLDVEALARR
jgi:hypothetical protein